ncbi:MAG: hypothetical protein K0R11_1212, partial [Acidimicrobiales bacterium]|nr:hypothetical protein [Acidimicrobiales bacterium]
PDYFEALTHGTGLLLSGGAVLMLLAGAVWFRKLCRFAI